MPRLNRKTNPKALGAEEETDSEEEFKAYKEGALSAPSWVRQAVKRGCSMKEVKPEHQVRADMRDIEATYREATYGERDRHEAPNRPSSSSCQETISDTEAVALSDFLLNEQETEEYFREEARSPVEVPTYSNADEAPPAPSWDMETLPQSDEVSTNGLSDQSSAAGEGPKRPIGPWYYHLLYGEPPIESTEDGWAQQKECDDFFRPPEIWW